MSAIRIAGFRGESRRVDPKMLGDTVGTASMNLNPGRDDFRPWQVAVAVGTVPAGRQSLYRMGRDAPSDTEFWLSWPGDVHVARTFDIEDATERTFYSGDGAPKVTDNLSLQAGFPSHNPIASRPLGIPAPATAPSVSVNVTAVDPNVGKTFLDITPTVYSTFTTSLKFRITVDDLDPQEFSLTADTAGAITKATLAADLDRLSGINAKAMASDDSTYPDEVVAYSDKAGAVFKLEKQTATKSNYDASVVTYQQLFSATGGSGADITLLSQTASGGSATVVVLEDTLLASLSAGDTLAIVAGSTTKASVVLPGNSRSSVIAALGGVSGLTVTSQEYVPATGGEGGSAGQAGGISISLGVLASGTKVVVKTNPPAAATLVVTQTWLTANAASGDKWQVAVNGASPVSITLAAGANTYPQVVTPASLKTALSAISDLKTTVETGANGVPQLRIENAVAGAGSTMVIKKIVPATEGVWQVLATSTVVKAVTRDVKDYFYCYTYVNDWGWESAPSPVSAVAQRTIKETAVVSGFASPPGGGYAINRIRLYRTQAGASGTADFFFLAEAASTASTITDSNQVIGEVLATKTWLTAPGVPRGGADNYTEPALSWLTPLWNGMMAGIVGKSVRFCEAYTGYAWPIAYDVVPPDGTPVGLGVYGQSLLVLTTSQAMVVSGLSPESMDPGPLKIPQACIAPRSIVSMGNGVAWASKDGLCWYGDGGTTVLTSGVMLRKDWLALRPETIIGQMYAGLYFGSYLPVDGQPRRGFLVNPADPSGIYFLDQGFDAAHFDPIQNQLYLLRGTQILKWEAGNAFMVATFRSKVFHQPRPISFAWGKVVGAAAGCFPVHFKMWADGRLRHTRTVLTGEPFRLPDGFTATDWQFEISSDQAAALPAVQGVVVASSVDELKEAG